MAGGERSGLEHAHASLFVDHPWLLTPGDGTPDGDLEALSAFVRGLGARPRVMDADAHDRAMAYLSHLPQIVSVALLGAAGRSLGADALGAAGPAFQEMTRVAGSSAEVWRGIVATNADFIAEAIEAFVRSLPHRAEELGDGSWTDAAFADAQRWRRPVTSGRTSR
jgi:prephenate dehydrogenase